MNKKTLLKPRSLFVLIFLFLFFYSWNVNWGKQRWKGFFISDSNGYYAYLPATFIYHDLSFSFIEQVHKKSFPTFGGFDFRNQQSGITNNKWFCGTAVAMLPFFLAGHALSIITGSDPDGYSFWYAWTVNLAAIVYCLMGLIALERILRRFFQSRILINFLLVLKLFATNLFYYSTSEPAMSHVYSFAFINLFVLCVLNFIERKQDRFIFFSISILGLIILIRPVNGICVAAIPFLVGSKERFKELAMQLYMKWKVVVLSLLVLGCILFIQLICYKIETGSFLVYSYGGEKTNLLNPHLFDFLFSYKKGLFVYLPLTFIALIGLPLVFRKSKWQFYSISLFVFLLCYVLSSWWNWWYGGSFGTRPMIEFLFVFSILLGFALEGLKGWAGKLFIALCVFLLILCQVQTYQYRYYFIHWDGMTKDSYWKVFMRIDLLSKNENPNKDLIMNSSGE